MNFQLEETALFCKQNVLLAIPASLYRHTALHPTWRQFLNLFPMLGLRRHYR
jgi:hypothetical protein